MPRPCIAIALALIAATPAAAQILGPRPGYSNDTLKAEHQRQKMQEQQRKAAAEAAAKAGAEAAARDGR